jgi:pimeloyl-ACP methyl ester carboxylesterase
VHLVTSGDVALAYDDADVGEPVHFVHGAFIADAFRPLFSEPALAGHRLIAYHRRGYGASDPAPASMTLEEHADDCRAVLLHAGVSRAHVVGHSFGALVALQLALDAPDLVGTLTLLEAGVFVGDSADSYRRGLEESAARYRDVGARVAVDEFFRLRWPTYRERLDGAVPGPCRARSSRPWRTRRPSSRSTSRAGSVRSSARRRCGGSSSRRSSCSVRRALPSTRASARRTACSESGCREPRGPSCPAQAISSSSSNRARWPRSSRRSFADIVCDSFTYRVNDGTLDSPAATVSVTVAAEQTMHVGDLDGASANNRKNWSASVTAAIHDAGEGPVAGATLTGSWTGGTSGSSSCVTGANGRCTVSKTGLPKKAASVSFTVTSVTRSAWTYTAAANHDPDGDSTGTSISVAKP